MSTDPPTHDKPTDERLARQGREEVQETESTVPGSPMAMAHVTIEGYEIIRELHRGGQGVVYEALQKSTRRKVAIKLLLAGQHAATSAKKRFEREIKLVAQLRHPNIISIFHSGVTGNGLQFYVMDYIRGLPLHHYVRDKKLTLEETLTLFSTVCEGVQYAHQRGVIHRDLKPSNILVDAEGSPKILDFGVAKPLAGGLDTAISITQEVIGTLPYMSPEQARGHPDEIDTRIDVYSLGVILYELLTGHFPYPVVGQIGDLLKHVVETAPTPLTQKWTSGSGVAKRTTKRLRPGECPIDSEVETIVLKALAKERERRYQSAGELAHDIGHYLKSEPIEARRDSLFYVVRTRCRAFAQRHRITSFLAVIVISMLLAQYIGVPLIFRWTPANEFFQRFVIGPLSLSVSTPAFEDVRIIALTDDTDVEAIAHREGLENVTIKNIRSLRRLHGRMMEKLAASRCRTVAWDIIFPGKTEFDESFARGVRALGDIDVDVVVSVPTWQTDGRGFPQLSETIAHSGTRWGCVLLRFGEEAPPTLQLVAQRGMLDPQPSLALAALASYRQPGKAFDIVLDSRTQSVDLRFWTADPRVPQAKQWMVPDHIPLTAGHIGDSESGAFAGAFAPEFGLQNDDLVGFYLFNVPPDSVLSASTIEYEQVFSADEEQLQQWFGDKAIIIGNFRLSAGDRHRLADGRILSACYGHAAAIDALLRKVFVRMPRVTGEFVIPLVGALLGCITALWAAGRALRRYLAMAVLTAVFLAASVIAYWKFQYLFNPLVPVLALLVAGEMSAAVHRVVTSRRG